MSRGLEFVDRGQYEHTQIGWTILISAAAAAVLGVFLLAAGAAVGAWITLAVVALLVFGFGTMTVRVGGEELDLRLGVGIVRKRIPLSEIRSAEPVRDPWWYGWGIRVTPHGLLYRVSGTGAVAVVLASGKQVRIGTDEPEALARALGGGTVGAADSAARAPQASRWLPLAAVVPVGIVAVVLGVIAMEARQPRVTVSADTLSVHSFVYGVDIPRVEIASVELVDRLPRILARTNGTGLGATLRGHFRVQSLGEGQLFLERDRPPFVLVKTRDSFVAIGFDDPERTRELHERLLAAP